MVDTAHDGGGVVIIPNVNKLPVTDVVIDLIQLRREVDTLSVSVSVLVVLNDNSEYRMGDDGFNENETTQPFLLVVDDDRVINNNATTRARTDSNRIVVIIVLCRRWLFITIQVTWE